MRTRSAYGLLAVALALTLVGAAAAQTAFTYQGRLSQAGKPFTGVADFTFTLWDAEVGGDPIGNPVVLNGVNVAQGLFTVPLDFGAVFAGARTWLEINVNNTPLAPRQELTPAPYALFSFAPWVTVGNVISYSAGNVGIGTANPGELLSVAGTIESTAGGFKFPDGTVQTTAATGGNGFWSANGDNIFNNNAGKVGIGTTAPASKLDIAATGDGAELLRFRTERPWVFRQVGSGSGTRLQLQSTVGLKNFEITAALGANVATFFADDAGSKVGIGTTNPLYTLDVRGSVPGISLGMQGNGGGALVLANNANDNKIYLEGYNSNGNGSAAEMLLTGYAGGMIPQITLWAAKTIAQGNVGIGVANPTSRLEIAAQDALTITGFQPFLTLRDSNAGNARGRIQSANGDINFYTEASLPSGVPPLKVYNSGLTEVRAIRIIGGADLAEQFEMSAPVSPGMVVEIDPEQSGKLRLSQGAYNRRVAGVISGANKLDAGVTLSDGNAQGTQQAVALSGRAWVYCDATERAVEVGDLLTTADRPGYAMSATDLTRAHGATIGKAMAGLARGEQGLVLVLINLQ